MTNIEESLFQAIDTIIHRRLGQAENTTVVTATVLSRVNFSTYKIRYQSMEIQASVLSPVVLAPFQSVHVLLTRGETTNTEAYILAPAEDIATASAEGTGLFIGTRAELEAKIQQNIFIQDVFCVVTDE